MGAIPKEFIVVDKAEDWEQPLGLCFGPGLPARGILTWPDYERGEGIAVFPDRRSAREAIKRTIHYGIAMEDQESYPRRQFCVVRPIALRPAVR